ncbi:MAG: phosphate/phosphite/phosphonate ABC transporter substrate-binding protein [Marinibacterium sp.]
MIASLPMYWRAENAGAWRRFWDLVRRRLPDLPDLTPPEDLPQPLGAHWLAPDLALSMTCGLPLRSALRDRVTYVGTLDFGLADRRGYYRSQVICRRGLAADAAGLRIAFNAPDSQSGWAAVDLPKGRFTDWVETGSHAASLAALTEDRADIAWIDAITWRLLKRFDPAAGEVEEIRQTPLSPGLPLITARGHDPAPLRAALGDAVAALPDTMRNDLGGLTGFAVLDPARYHEQPVPPPPPA